MTVRSRVIVVEGAADRGDGDEVETGGEACLTEAALVGDARNGGMAETMNDDRFNVAGGGGGVGVAAAAATTGAVGRADDGEGGGGVANGNEGRGGRGEVNESDGRLAIFVVDTPASGLAKSSFTIGGRSGGGRCCVADAGGGSGEGNATGEGREPNPPSILPSIGREILAIGNEAGAVL